MCGKMVRHGFVSQHHRELFVIDRVSEYVLARAICTAAL